MNMHKNITMLIFPTILYINNPNLPFAFLELTLLNSSLKLLKIYYYISAQLYHPVHRYI